MIATGSRSETLAAAYGREGREVTAVQVSCRESGVDLYRVSWVQQEIRRGGYTEDVETVRWVAYVNGVRQPAEIRRKDAVEFAVQERDA